jgi:ketosteroid isomerase-like protein
MGADENAAIIRRGYEAFNSGDMNTLTELFDESASWHTPGRGSLAGYHQGREGDLCLLRPAGGEDGRGLQGHIAALAQE